jgi:hypothetical protein
LGSAMAGNHSRGDAPATTEEPHAVLCYRWTALLSIFKHHSHLPRVSEWKKVAEL